MLSKRLMPSLTRETFVTPTAEILPEVVDLPEIYLVEVPMVHWLTAKGPCRLDLR